MKDNFIHVCFIIDESGSMYQSVSDVKGGFKKVIDEQKSVKDGECVISMFKFNSEVNKVFIGKNVNDIDDIDYSPNGMTAMNDGIGGAIDEVGKWLSDMDESERPSKNIVVIMTDGLENASKEYSFSRVKEMIKHQEEKYNWTFIYMGVDLTSKEDADKLGIKISAFSNKSEINNHYEVINSATTKLRLAKTVTEARATMDWLSDQALDITNKYETENNIKL